MVPQVARASRVPASPIPPQGVDQHIGEGREPQPELIGGHGGRRRAVGEEIELLLLDTVFHVAPRTVDPLVQPAAADLIRVQGGNDEARIGSFRQVLGLGHHRGGRLQLSRVW